MSEGARYFDRALVMDSLMLTGPVLCDLVDEVAGHSCSEHLTSLLALHARLASRVQSDPDERLLIITELTDGQGRLQDGMALLADLQDLRLQGRCRVVVCTGQTDPLLLKAVVNRRPSVVVLRREPLDALRMSVQMAGVAWPDTVLSPAVTEGMMLTRDVTLSPRELEFLVTQADGLGLKASAKVMNISYKTVATYRHNLTRRLERGRKGAFSWRMAQIQKAGGSG